MEKLRGDTWLQLILTKILKGFGDGSPVSGDWAFEDISFQGPHATELLEHLKNGEQPSIMERLQDKGGESNVSTWCHRDKRNLVTASAIG